MVYICNACFFFYITLIFPVKSFFLFCTYYCLELLEHVSLPTVLLSSYIPTNIYNFKILNFNECPIKGYGM